MQDLFGSGAKPGQTGGMSRVTGEQRSVTSQLTEDDLEVDRTLRPKTLDQYVGQERVRENLRVLIDAAK